MIIYSRRKPNISRDRFYKNGQLKPMLSTCWCICGTGISKLAPLLEGS